MFTLKYSFIHTFILHWQHWSHCCVNTVTFEQATCYGIIHNAHDIISRLSIFIWPRFWNIISTHSTLTKQRGYAALLPIRLVSQFRQWGFNQVILQNFIFYTFLHSLPSHYLSVKRKDYISQTTEKHIIQIKLNHPEIILHYILFLDILPRLWFNHQFRMSLTWSLCTCILKLDILCKPYYMLIKLLRRDLLGPKSNYVSHKWLNTFL
jgi:hypothetical protein